MQKPKIGALLSLNSFPLWKKCARPLLSYCDYFYVRYDMKSGDPQVLKDMESFFGDKLKAVGLAQDGWRPPQWREEGLQLIHDAKEKPDIVLCPDEDEVFDRSIADELIHFWNSDKKGMMFDYHPLETNDGREVNGGMPYPPDPHMKAFKYSPECSYFPYHGDAKIATYANQKDWFLSKSKIHHFPCFTKLMERSKHFRSDTPKGRGVKAVTILGFGPSSAQDIKVQGEVWSLNNCYDVYKGPMMKRITRVFEMHKLGERVGPKWEEIRQYLKVDQLQDVGARRSAADGITHKEHLNMMGKTGVRIIMQQADPEIANSEAYPIEDVVTRLGLDWFAGTPAYMVALAILQGYTHINVYGVDALDHEHTLQRENFAALMCYAVGRGIQIGGALTFLEPYKGNRYGYDRGPEESPFHEKMLFRGHPFTLRYKTPSRAMVGDMFKPGGK